MDDVFVNKRVVGNKEVVVKTQYLDEENFLRCPAIDNRRP